MSIHEPYDWKVAIASCILLTVTFLELGKLMLFGFENGGLEKQDEMLKRGANVEKRLKTIAARSITCSLL